MKLLRVLLLPISLIYLHTFDRFIFFPIRKRKHVKELEKFVEEHKHDVVRWYNAHHRFDNLPVAFVNGEWRWIPRGHRRRKK